MIPTFFFIFLFFLKDIYHISTDISPPPKKKPRWGGILWLYAVETIQKVLLFKLKKKLLSFCFAVKYLLVKVPFPQEMTVIMTNSPVSRVTTRRMLVVLLSFFFIFLFSKINVYNICQQLKYGVGSFLFTFSKIVLWFKTKKKITILFLTRHFIAKS